MSVDDFEGMDTDEFQAVCTAFNEHEDNLRHDAWERARIVGTLSVSPYVKGKANPMRILPLPWDGAQKRKPSRPIPGKAEDKRRLEALMKSLRKDGNDIR